MSGSGRETLPYVQKWWGGPPEWPGVVGRPSWISRSGREPPRMSGSGLDALPDVREWSRGPPGCP